MGEAAGVQITKRFRAEVKRAEDERGRAGRSSAAAAPGRPVRRTDPSMVSGDFCLKAWRCGGRRVARVCRDQLLCSLQCV